MDEAKTGKENMTYKKDSGGKKKKYIIFTIQTKQESKGLQAVCFRKKERKKVEKTSN